MAKAYDHYNRPEPAVIYLSKPGRHLYCALNGVEYSTVNVSKKTNNTTELTCDVHRIIDGELSNGYDHIAQLMELYCDGIWYKIAEQPSVDFDGTDEIMHVTAQSYEIGLMQYDLVNFDVNTGSTWSYEMVYREEHNNDQYYQVKFCDKENEDLSLLHLILRHAEVPGWTIGYIDDITPNPNYPTLYLKDEVYLFSIETQNVYTTLTQDVAKAFSCIFDFDTVDLKINAYRVESLGKDTNVYLGFRNLQNNITISGVDELYTVFTVTGADDMRIDYVNFGYTTLEDISYFLTTQFLPQELIDKYKAWLAYREEQRPIYIELSKKYNTDIKKLSEIQNRVPVDGVNNDWQHMEVEELKTAYDDYTAIITGLENLYVDDEGNFDLDALKESSDWPLYESIMNYVLPQIVASLQEKEDPDTITNYGSGNILSNASPAIMDSSWSVLDSTAENKCIDITDAPAWGITRGLYSKTTNASESFGFEQRQITVTKGTTYVLSAYVKSTTNSVSLMWGTPGEARQSQSFNVAPNVWTRVYIAFSAATAVAEIAYSASGGAGSELTVCGMQLEMGMQPSSFGYFSLQEETLFSFETDWKLYGIVELKAKLNSYNDVIRTLEKNGYSSPNNDLIDVEEDYQNQMYQQYLDYKQLAADCQAALEERQAEYDAIKAELDEVQEQRNTIAANVEKDKFGEVQDVYEGFTKDELFRLGCLYKQTNYQNDNIVTTDLDTLSDEVDIQLKLYNDAVEQLYAESHPQYNYTNTAENLYALPEFKAFHEDLDVNNFIRVAIRDDYCVKLRAIQIDFNPCTYGSDIQITFSNMTQYKSKRNDFVALLDNAIKSTKRQVVGGANEQITTYSITPEVISQLLRSSQFKNFINNSTGGIVGTGSGSIITGGDGSGTITAEAVIAALVQADKGQFGELTADTAFITYLSSTLITTEKIVAGIVEADQAQIDELYARIITASQIDVDVANIKNLLAGTIGGDDAFFINLTADNAIIDSALIQEAIIGKLSVADLIAHDATLEEITLITQNGKKSISFKGATQQFYDANDNVRVQIGQDGNGDFNFVVFGANGSAALFDSNGITKDGIPDNTIVNNMITDNTIGKEKMGFHIVDTDENGNVDISHIVMDGEQFSVKYVQFVNETQENIDDLKGQMVYVQVVGEQAFIESNGVITPDEITLTAVTKNDTSIGKWYIDDVENTSFVSPDKTMFTIPSSYMEDKKSITVKVESADGKAYDVISVYRLVDGSATITPVISSSMGTDFADDTLIASTTLTCTVYRGSEIIEPNSYVWEQKIDDNESWAQIGSQATLAILLSAFTDICSIRCKVDV